MKLATRLAVLALLALAGPGPSLAQCNDGCATCGPCKSCCDVWNGFCHEVKCCPCCGHRQGGILCRIACGRLNLFKPKCDCCSSCKPKNCCSSGGSCSSGGRSQGLPDALPPQPPAETDDILPYDDDSPAAPPTPLDLEGSVRPLKKASHRHRHHQHADPTIFRVAPASVKAR